jgi:hypothetical protein
MRMAQFMHVIGIVSNLGKNYLTAVNVNNFFKTFEEKFSHRVSIKPSSNPSIRESRGITFSLAEILKLRVRLHSRLNN